MTIPDKTEGRDGDLCSDCPPVGYPTDKTRCLPCPRRCTDFDEDCFGLDHLHCWLYDPSKGYCPFLSENP